MGRYILKRLFIMIPTFLLISLLVFIIVNLAPGRAGQTQLSGGQGESVRETAGAREGYRLFKLQYGLNRPLLWNDRYALDAEDVQRALEIVAQNLTTTLAGETEALHVGEVTAGILSHHAFPEYWELTAALTNPDLSAENRALLEIEQRQAPLDQIVIRPPRPDPEVLSDAQEILEDWGMYAVPHLIELAHNHPNAKVRWQAVEYLTLNAQDNAVDPENGAIVARHPERGLERLTLSIVPDALERAILRTSGPMLGVYATWAVQSRELTAFLRRTLPRADVETWTYPLGASAEQVDGVLARWDAWLQRNSHRLEYDFWDEVLIFFTDTRLALYWSNLFTGNLGVSSQYKRPVIDVIAEHWKYTIYLSLLSIFFAYGLSVPIGMYSAVKQGGLFDRGVGLLLFLLYSLPSFFLGTLLQDYLTRARDPDTVWMIVRYATYAFMVVVVPLFVAVAFRDKAYQRGARPATARLNALLALVIAATVGFFIVEGLRRLGIWLAVALLVVAWPLFSTIRHWRAEVRQVRAAGVSTRVPFPAARFSALALAGLGGSAVLQFLHGLFPAPVSGFASDGMRLGATTFDYFGDVVTHLVLPVACLTYGQLAYFSRYARTGLLDVIRSDYVRTARAKGLSEPVVIIKHALRNGMIPILTLLGFVLPALIGGSLIVEYIFNIPGMGQLVLFAVQQKDFNVILGVLQISAVLTLFGVLLSDISYALVDPRISFD